MERHFSIATLTGVVILSALASFSLAAATLVGNTSGSFAVSASGNATYRLALSLPSGTAGMTPELALVYSSGAGDGVAGWGWGISGISSIRRCTKTYAQNGTRTSISYSSGDRLCLDGNQLMLHSGSYLSAGAVYRGEIDNFTKVTQVGSGTSAYFKVEYPNGHIAEFGSTTASRKLKDGSSAILEWAISKIEDRSANGNAITFNYSTDAGGALLPQSVSYAPFYIVDFIYQGRPAGEARVQWHAGSEAGYTQRLDRIEIRYNGNNIVRRYELSYESSLSPVTKRSRLASIQECGVGTADCYKPLTFDWQDASSARHVMDYLSAGSSAAKWQWGDINGDGLDDAVFHGCGPSCMEGIFRLTYYLSSGNGSMVFGASDIVWDDEQANTFILLDYNNDGRLDVGFGRDPTGGTNRKLAIATWNNGFHESELIQTDIVFSEDMQVLDVDGDGYPELVKFEIDRIVIYRNNSPANPAFSLTSKEEILAEDIDPSLGTASFSVQQGGVVAMDPPDPPEWSPTLKAGRSADVDGDGREDLLVPVVTIAGIQWYAGFSRFTESGAGMVFAPLGLIHEPTLGDVNGDGLADLVYLTSSDVVHLRLSKGFASGSVDQSFGADITTGIVIEPYTLDDNKYLITLVDVNLDGMQDLFWVDSQVNSSFELEYRWRRALSTGTNFGSPSDWGLGGGGFSSSLAPLGVLDQNGDGAVDLAMSRNVSLAGNANDYAPASDTLTKITDSYGLVTSIAHEPLVTVHDWSDQGAIDNAYRAPPHGQVVNRYTSSDGIGGTFEVSYTYSGGMFDRRGRGFLGFVSRTAEDDRLPGVETKTTYSQSFPYIGRRVAQETRWTSDGELITEEKTEFAKVPRGSGDEQYTQVYAAASVEQTYGVNAADRGLVTRSVRTDRSNPDFWGNPRTLVVTHSPSDQSSNADPSGLTTTTNLTFQNDIANWCLGLPIDRMTSSQLEYRHGTASYLNCRLQTKIVGYGTTKAVTTSYVRDAFGNVTTETVSAPGEISRVTDYEWSPDGRFLLAVENALGHRTTTEWYEDTGLPEYRTGPNGLTVNWFYDNLGNRTREERPDGTETVWSRVYCSSNCGVTNGEYVVTETQQRTGVSGSIHGRTQSVIDSLERVLEVRRPNLHAGSSTWGIGWSATRNEYDALGRLHKQSMPFEYGTEPQHKTVRSYDVLGRLVSEVFASGGVNGYAYNGLVTTITDPLNHRTIKEEDAKGRVVSVTDAYFNDTIYAYDGFDNLTDTWAPGNSHIHIEYDDRGFKESVDDPDMGNWSYYYNAYGELESQTDAKNQVVTLTYDTLGRLKTRIENNDEDVTTWTYDGPGGSLTIPMIGKLYTVSQVEGGVEVYGEETMYDSQGRPLQVTTSIDGADYTTNYAYDVYGRLASVEYPNSFETVINNPPTANINMVSSHILPGAATMDGRGSTDDNFPNPDLQYTWSQIDGPGTVSLSGAGSAIASFTPTLPGHYTFQLEVFDGADVDQASAAVNVKPSAPGAPSVLSEVPSTSYTVTWSQPVYGVTANTRYELQEATNSGFTSNARIIPASGTSASVTARSNTTTYYYRVRACEGATSTWCGAWSATRSTTVRLAPGAPSGVNATPSSTDTGIITVTWNAASGNVTNYRLEEMGSGRYWNTGTTRSKSLTQATPGSWSYRVRAYNSSTGGSYSNTDSVNVVTPATLAAPAVTSEDDMTGDFTITWNSGGSGVSRYDMQRRVTLGSTTYNWTTQNKGTSRTHSESNVDSGDYEFRVRTCKATGCGNWSGIRTITIVRPQWDKCPPNCDDPWGASTAEPVADEPVTEGATQSAPADSTAPASDTTAPTTGESTPSPESGNTANDIARNDASVITHANGMPVLRDAAMLDVANTNRNGFRLMPPARPYDLARRQASRDHSTFANAPARALKTSSAALVATASTTTLNYRFKVTYEYDQWSHLVQVKNAAGGTVYWQANNADAAGHLVNEQYGNGVMVSHLYDPASGLVQEISASNASAESIQFLAYDWDTAGNLEERRDERAVLTEHFYYDSLNRLDYSTLASPMFSGTNLDIAYDAAGNITNKTGVGDYYYESTRTHAITRLERPDNTTDTFTYDANGNLTSGAGKTVTWTHYNYPASVSRGGSTVTFQYGPDRQRVQESGPGYTRTTVNAYFEVATEG
ncbi:MAG TPA: toxin TcdB middle/N-terminal domain-containing protein, partial [Gammaproteobacteria bacterium]